MLFSKSTWCKEFKAALKQFPCLLVEVIRCCPCLGDEGHRMLSTRRLGQAVAITFGARCAGGHLRKLHAAAVDALVPT